MPKNSPAAFTRRQKALTLAGVLLGLLLAALDQTIVATAGPAIQKSLGIPASLYVWLTTAYLVSSVVLVPVYGKLSDRYGRRAILLVGIGIFLLGSFLCGVAHSTVQLVVFRALQGTGAASLFTSAFAVVADLYEPAERGKYQGLFGAMFGLSSVVGPLVGGFITDVLGWHWVFFINLPLGALAILLISTRMPALKPKVKPGRIDVAGAVTLALCVVPLLLALSLGRPAQMPADGGYAWSSPLIVGLFAAALVGLSLFIGVERRAEDPLLDLRLFRQRAFGLGNLASFVVGGSFLSAITFLPLFMVNVVGLSATRSGLTTTPLTFGIVLTNLAVGQLISRLGRYKPLLVGALVIQVVAFGLLGFTLTPDTSQLGVSAKMVLAGIGLAPAIPIFTLAIQTSVPMERLGVATASAAFSRQMGATIGLALVGTAFGTTLAGGLHHGFEAAQLPPGLAQALRASAAPSGSEGAQGQGVDLRALELEVTARFNLLRARLELATSRRDRRELEAIAQDAYLPPVLRPPIAALAATPAGEPLPPVSLHPLEPSGARVIVEDGHRAVQVAFTEAISRIYRLCILIALLGLAVVMLLPEQPLRGVRSKPAPVAD